jgi:hypothetical protein
LNAVGDELTSATSSFDIQPEVSAGVSLETDKLSYDAGETATISAVVSNRSANSSLAGGHVRLSLNDPANQPLDQWDLSAGDVTQGRSTLVSQDKPLHGLAPGTYRASARLLAADGAELAHANAELVVRSSADTGGGVRGSLTASPTDPQRFTTATFRYSLTNAGNADIPGAIVRVRVSDLDSGGTLKTLDEARTITRGGPNTGTLLTTADMAENRDYQASLHLVLADGSERPLDRAIIHVRPTPFTYGASFDTSPRSRVLVWACDSSDEAAARAALGSTFATYVTGRPTSHDPGEMGCGNFGHDEEDRYMHQSRNGECEWGCGRFGHEERDRFMRLMRSGNYNQFWIIGRRHPLERSMVDELSARVIQGDGLLVVGSGADSDLFSECSNLSPLGVAFAGTLPPGSYTLQFASASPFAGLDARVTGAPVRVTTTQATALATTTWGPTHNRKTAITATYNQFGKGKAIYVGAAPSAFPDPAQAAAVLRTAAGVLLPPADVTRAAGLARLDLFVEGHAPGSPLELRTQLPARMDVPQPPADATFAGGLLTLPFDTAGLQRKLRSVWLKLPTGAPSATTVSTAYYRDAADGQMKPYGNPATATLGIVERKETARDAALAALGRIGNASYIDQLWLRKIKDDVAAATLETSDARVLGYRLRALVYDIGILERSRWTNTDVARTTVARLITYLEYDYYLAGGK